MLGRRKRTAALDRGLDPKKRNTQTTKRRRKKSNLVAKEDHRSKGAFGKKMRILKD